MRVRVQTLGGAGVRVTYVVRSKTTIINVIYTMLPLMVVYGYKHVALDVKKTN